MSFEREAPPPAADFDFDGVVFFFDDLAALAERPLRIPLPLALFTESVSVGVRACGVGRLVLVNGFSPLLFRLEMPISRTSEGGGVPCAMSNAPSGERLTPEVFGEVLSRGLSLGEVGSGSTVGRFQLS